MPRAIAKSARKLLESHSIFGMELSISKSLLDDFPGRTFY